MLVVVGGGCFGCYHTRQLLKAIRAGPLRGQRLTVVDRDPDCQASREFAGDPEVAVVVEDWLSFLSRWLGSATAADRVVPAPLAPHLVWEWLAGELGAMPAEAPRAWGLPYEVPGPRGELFLSAAAWTCPATCVEPRHCPVLHAPRDWDLSDLIEERAGALGYLPAVFRCMHLAGGVGALSPSELVVARERARTAGGGRRILVATSSRCHAAIGVLAVPADAKLGR